MDHAGNNQAESLQRRIRHLEALLEEQACRLAHRQHELMMIQSTTAHRLLGPVVQLCHRWLPPGTWRHAAARMLYRLASARTAHSPSNSQSYTTWISQLESADQHQQSHSTRSHQHQPVISLLLRLSDCSAESVERTVASVCAQRYGNWQLCLVQPTEADTVMPESVSDSMQTDSRVQIVFTPTESSLADDWNLALEATNGDFVTWVGPGDELSSSALEAIVEALHEHPLADAIYTDEDQLLDDGSRCHPVFKPGWSPDLLRSTFYLGRLLVLRREFLTQLEGFQAGYEGAEEFDLALRIAEKTDAVIHLPRVLYHRSPRSTAADSTDTKQASNSARRALREHLIRQNIEADVREGLVPQTYQVTYPLPEEPLISIVIPNCDAPQDLRRCLQSVRTSSYSHYEVLIVENGSRQPETFELYEEMSDDPRIHVLTWDRPFNYSAVNNWAASQARGELLLLLNNDTEAINPDWLRRMAEHAVRPEVGAVGAKLYFSDRTIQHGGVIIGLGPVAGHSHRFLPGDSPGHANRLVTVQNLSAVTAACLLVRKDVYASAGGLDEQYPLALNDVDFCLRLRQAGYRILWTPFAELFHHESKTRGRDDTPEKQARSLQELAQFYRRWHKLLLSTDPFYNPNLTDCLEDFSLRNPEAFGGSRQLNPFAPRATVVARDDQQALRAA